MAKKITAPKTYDPGKGRPKEHLAYLNEREMAYLRSINGNNMERGPKGLPSFPPKDAVGSSSKASPSRGPGGPSGPNSSPSGSRGIGGGGKGSTTGGRGPGGPSGPNSAASGSRGVGGGTKGPGGPSGPNSGPSVSRGPSQAKTPSSGGYKGPASPMSGQGTSFKSPSTYSDRSIQQKVQTASTQKAVRSVPAVRSDLSSGGIRTLNVGPMGTPVKVSRPSASGMSFTGPQSVSKPSVSVAAREAYKPSMKALSAVTRGPGSVSGSMPGNTDPVAAQRSIQAITNSLNEQFGKNYTPDQVNKIVKTIAGEAAGESPFGQAAVANTMLNRISLASTDPEKYGYMGGRTVNSLLGQYDAAGMRPGTVQNAVFKSSVPGRESYRVAMNALSEASNPSGQFAKTASPEVLAATHYYNPATANPRWGRRSGTSFETVGAHAFGNAEPTQRAVREARSVAPASGAPSGSGIISSAYAADEPTGPLMSGNARPQGSFVSGAVNAITDALNNPSEYQVSIPEAPAFVKAMPDKLKQAAIYAEAKKFGEDLPGRVSSGIEAIQNYTRPTVQTATAPKVSPSAEDAYGPKYVSPEVQEEMAEIDKMNRRGTRVMKAATGPIGRAADAVRGLITGKNTAEADADLKRAYMQGNAAQRAELERRNPNLTKFAQQAGLEPQLPMSNYENWRQRSFGTGGAGGVSTTVVGSGGTPDFGSGGKFQYRPGPGSAPYSPPPTTTEKAERGRPQQYYNWDAGVGIPSPGDSDYTLYLKYLEEKAAARAAVS